MKIKNALTLLVLMLGTVMLFGAVATQPTAQAPYKPISELGNCEVVGDISAEFASLDDMEQTQEKAFAALLEAAKAQYGENVSVGDIVWVATETAPVRRELQPARALDVATDEKKTEDVSTARRRTDLSGKKEGTKELAPLKAAELTTDPAEAKLNTVTFKATAKVVTFPSLEKAVDKAKE